MKEHETANESRLSYYFHKWKDGREARDFLVRKHVMAVVEAGLEQLLVERPGDPCGFLARFLKAHNPNTPRTELTITRPVPARFWHAAPPRLLPMGGERSLPNWRQAGDLPVWGMALVGTVGWKRAIDQLKRTMPSLDRLIVVDTEQLPVVHLKTRGGGEILPYSTDLRLPRKDESRFATLVVPFGEDGASRAVASSVRGAAETMEGYLQEGLKNDWKVFTLQQAVAEASRTRESRRVDVQVVRVPVGQTSYPPLSAFDSVAQALSPHLADLASNEPRTAVVVTSLSGGRDVTHGMLLAAIPVAARVKVMSSTARKRQWRERVRDRDVRKRKAIAEVEMAYQEAVRRDKLIAEEEFKIVREDAARGLEETEARRSARLGRARAREAKREAQLAKFHEYLDQTKQTASTKIAAVYRGHSVRSKVRITVSRSPSRQKRRATRAPGAHSAYVDPMSKTVRTSKPESARYILVLTVLQTVMQHFTGSDLFTMRSRPRTLRRVVREQIAAVPQPKHVPGQVEDSDDELFVIRQVEEEEDNVAEDFAVNPMDELNAVVTQCGQIANLRDELLELQSKHVGELTVQYRGMKGVRHLALLLLYYIWSLLRSVCFLGAGALYRLGLREHDEDDMDQVPLSPLPPLKSPVSRSVQAVVPPSLLDWLAGPQHLSLPLLRNHHLVSTLTVPTRTGGVEPLREGPANPLADRILVKAGMARDEEKPRANKKRSLKFVNLPEGTPPPGNLHGAPSVSALLRNQSGVELSHRAFRRTHRKLPLFCAPDPLSKDDLENLVRHFPCGAKSVLWLSLSPNPIVYVGACAFQCPLTPLTTTVGKSIAELVDTCEVTVQTSTHPRMKGKKGKPEKKVKQQAPAAASPCVEVFGCAWEAYESRVVKAVRDMVGNNRELTYYEHVPPGDHPSPSYKKAVLKFVDSSKEPSAPTVEKTDSDRNLTVTSTTSFKGRPSTITLETKKPQAPSAVPHRAASISSASGKLADLSAASRAEEGTEGKGGQSSTVLPSSQDPREEVTSYAEAVKVVLAECEEEPKLTFVRLPVFPGLSVPFIKAIDSLTSSIGELLRSCEENFVISVMHSEDLNPPFLLMATVAYAMYSRQYTGVDPFDAIVAARKAELEAFSQREQRMRKRSTLTTMPPQDELETPARTSQGSARSATSRSFDTEEEEEEESEEPGTTETTTSASDEPADELSLTRRLMESHAALTSMTHPVDTQQDDEPDETVPPPQPLSPFPVVDELASSHVGKEIDLAGSIAYLDTILSHSNKHIEEGLLTPIATNMLTASTSGDSSVVRAAALAASQHLELYCIVLFHHAWLASVTSSDRKSSFDTWLYSDYPALVSWLNKLDPWGGKGPDSDSVLSRWAVQTGTTKIQ